MILHTAHSAINSPSFGRKLSDNNIMNFNIDARKQRSTNSLELRRQLKSWSLPSKKKPHYNLEQPKMDRLSFCAIIESNDSSKIVQLSDEIIKCCNASKDYFSEITSSLEAIEAFTNAFMSSTSQEVTKSMIMAISSMFPMLSSNIMCAVVDCGMAQKLYQQFNPITETIIPSINLIITVSKLSSYGRDSILSMGIHELLIKSAMETDDPNISIGCCEALQSIFENPEKIDSDCVENYITAIVELLSIEDDGAKNAVLRTLCAIAHQIPSTVNYFIDEDAHILVLDFLQSPELQSSGLNFVSKLCYTNEHLKLQEMVDNGLVEILFDLILTDHTASVLHVFSCLFKKIPDIIFPLLPPDFINQLIEISNSSPFLVMKEAAFLLTILIRTENQNDTIENYMIPEIVDILVNMLSSSQDDIILPCLNALNKIVNAAESTSNLETLLPMLDETDITPILTSLEKSATSVSLIGVRATKLIELLNSFDN